MSVSTGCAYDGQNMSVSCAAPDGLDTANATWVVELHVEPPSYYSGVVVACVHVTAAQAPPVQFTLLLTKDGASPQFVPLGSTSSSSPLSGAGTSQDAPAAAAISWAGRPSTGGAASWPCWWLWEVVAATLGVYGLALLAMGVAREGAEMTGDRGLASRHVYLGAVLRRAPEHVTRLVAHILVLYALTTVVLLLHYDPAASHVQLRGGAGAAVFLLSALVAVLALLPQAAVTVMPILLYRCARSLLAWHPTQQHNKEHAKGLGAATDTDGSTLHALRAIDDDGSTASNNNISGPPAVKPTGVCGSQDPIYERQRRIAYGMHLVVGLASCATTLCVPCAANEAPGTFALVVGIAVAVDCVVLQWIWSYLLQHYDSTNAHGERATVVIDSVVQVKKL